MQDSLIAWQSHYRAPDITIWQDQHVVFGHCFCHHITPINLLTQMPEKTQQTAFALLGCETQTVGPDKTANFVQLTGPTAIRQRLAKLPVQNTNLICYDVGNIIFAADREKTQQALAELISALLSRGITPIILGGDHELTIGHYLGIVKTYPQKKLGIINFDTHFDMQPPQPNANPAASAFYQIAELEKNAKRRFDYNCIGIQHAANSRHAFDLAKKHHTHYILADDLYQGLEEKCFDFVDRVIDENELIYLSIALDVFSAAFAPGVNALQPLGLNPWHVIPLIRQAAASTKVISYDIAELIPQYDLDHRTAKLAATLIYEIIHHHSRNKPH